MIMLFFFVSSFSTCYFTMHCYCCLCFYFSLFLSCMYNNMVTKASVCVYFALLHTKFLCTSLYYIYLLCDANGDCNSSPFHRIV